MSLPNGYKQAEYIRSTGTQWIDTGFKPNANTRIVMDVENLNAAASTCYFGARSAASSTNAYACVFFTNIDGASNMRLDYYGSSKNVSCNSLRRLLIDWNKNVTSIGGATTVTNTASTKASAYNLCLLAVNTAGAVNLGASVKLYSCQIYDNGTLIRDFVPCTNASGTAGLYDMVNGAFYGNSGTGAFTADDKLPAGYTQVEYIESSGTQYIDTGFTANNNTKAVMDCELTYPSGWVMVMGSFDSAAYFSWWTKDSVLYAYYGSANQNMTGPVGRTILTADKNVWSAGGASLTFTASTFTASSPLYLFSISSGGDYALGVMKLYSCRIYDNGSLIRDFVPCVNTSGEAGLYDLSGGQFYANAGSGSFTAGAALIYVPDTPANLTADVSGSAAVLRWDASEGADGYRISRSGVLLADTADTSHTDASVIMYGAYTYTVTAYNTEGESAAAAVSVVIPGSENVLDDLITDRTLSDVTGHTKKGVYNACDLNRVSTAAAYVRALLTEYGYLCGTDARADWETNEIPRRSGLEAHYASVAKLDVIRYAAEKLKLPGTAEKLTWEDANAIEAFLLACGRAAERIPEAWVFSGECICGEI